MIKTEHAVVNTSILGGFKILLILLVGVFAFFQINPLSSKKSLGVTALGDSYPFVIPNMLKEGYIGENPQILNARSVWVFTIKNENSKSIDNLQIELPFSGSYYADIPGMTKNSNIATFTRQIQIPSLTAGSEAKITLWAGDELNTEYQRKISVRSDAGMIQVEYPLKASALVTWVERNKTPLSVGLFILFLIIVL